MRRSLLSSDCSQCRLPMTLVPLLSKAVQARQQHAAGIVREAGTPDVHAGEEGPPPGLVAGRQARPALAAVGVGVSDAPCL